MSIVTFNAIKKIIETRQFGQGIPTASEILPGLFIGDATAAMNAVEAGFTAIVNCAASDCLTNRDYYADSIKYIESDISTSVLPERVEDFIDRHLDVGRKVLIHCTSGINLSAVVAIAYYMVRMNVGVVAAVKHCFECRPIILTVDFFVRALVAFDDERQVNNLQLKVSLLSDELTAAKRQIAVLTQDCDYEFLTLGDLEVMMKNADCFANGGLTSDEKAKKYLRICEKYDEKKKCNV
jgi:protein-tyrosine phosphatase